MSRSGYSDDYDCIDAFCKARGRGVSVFYSAWQRGKCWWFGCAPDYNHSSELSTNYVVPCKRCGSPDTSYGDRVGHTRHRWAVEWLRYWVFRRWWPAKCRECGGRFGHRGECDGCPF